MKKFFLEGFFFCIPPIIFCLFIFCIDPYNYFNVSKLISDETKYIAANRSNEIEARADMLLKVIKFRRNPCRNVIIGNSQGFNISEKLISKLTGEEYYNFCVPAATLGTTISTFWFVIKQTKPKKVFLQVSFALSNSSKKRTYNLFHFAQDYIDKPYLYFMNKDILIDSYFNLKFELAKQKYQFAHTPELNLKNGIDSLYEPWLHEIFLDYTYPEKDLLELNKISVFCKNNHIELEFIIIPCYCRVDNFLLEKGLVNMRDRFRNDISSLGKTYDYLTERSIINNEANFDDYFHQNQKITDSLTVLIWQQKKDSITINLK